VFNLVVNFPSKEWLIKYQEALNGEAGKAWQEAAKDWEGDFLFVIEADDKLEKDLTFYIDLWHGECRRVEFIEDPAKAPQTEFQYRGKYSNWVDLIHGKIDPIKGILMRKFKLVGNKAKVLRAAKAAQELVNTAQKIESVFL